MEQMLGELLPRKKQSRIAIVVLDVSGKRF